MTDATHECPQCAGRMKFTHTGRYGSFSSKRRLCPKCGHADRVLLKIEIVRIVEVQKRVCRHTSGTTRRKKSRNNESAR